jgi:peptidoglycan/LPS O-acetylase OafA/YrhL
MEGSGPPFDFAHDDKLTMRGLGATPRLGVLDGLRGIAILLVLWYHIWEISWLSPWPWLQFLPATGFVGVPLFFFLSGFVISYPFVRAVLNERREPTWPHFAWRRFIKIVPSYTLSIAVAYAIGYAQLQPNASLLPDLVTHLLFIHTWFPLRYGTIDGVLWTLAVEVEFYCIFPLIWWCFKRQPWLTAGVMVALAWYWRVALSTCCFVTLFAQYEENLPGYLDIFAFGMIAAYVFTRCGDRARASHRYAGPLVALAGVAFFVALLQNLYAHRFYDQWSGVWQINSRPLLGAAFAIIALGWLFSPRWWQAVLDNAPLRFLAAVSYNLYLYHQLIARGLLWHHVPPYHGVPQEDPKWQLRYTVAALATTIAQAALITYCFERPLLKIRLKDVARQVRDERHLDFPALEGRDERP